MARNRQGQRGEGKVGCILSLLVFLVLAGVAAKIVPYWWSVDQLVNTADELASRAGVLNNDTLMAQLKAKAREQELPEAMAPGAIRVTLQGAGESGMCTITLKFSRDLDMYGITKFTWATDKTISKPWGRY
jgi:hypothetical protein